MDEVETKKRPIKFRLDQNMTKSPLGSPLTNDPYGILRNRAVSTI